MGEETAREAGFALAMRGARRPSGLVLGTVVAVLLTALLFALGPVARALIPPELSTQAGVLGVAPVFLTTWLLLWLWLRVKEQRPFATIGFAILRRRGKRGRHRRAARPDHGRRSGVVAAAMEGHRALTR